MQELVQEWRKHSKNSRHQFYEAELVPRITERLAAQYADFLTREGLEPYTTLVVVIDHNTDPVKILAGTIRPRRMIAFYQRKHEKSCGELKKYLAQMHGDCQLELHIIEPNDHEHNQSLFNLVLAQAANDAPVLCDITTGKKIFSVMLTLMANVHGFDYCYIDSREYLPDSPTPVPGQEIICLRRAEAQIGELSVSRSNRLGINLHHDALVFSPDNGRIADYPIQLSLNSIKNECRDLLGRHFAFINNQIGSGQGMQTADSLREIAGSLKSFFIMENDLDRALRSLAGNPLLLDVDPQLTGIPWEIMLDFEYGIKGPFLRRLRNRDSLSGPSVNPEDSEMLDVLFITGNGEGIDDFDEQADAIEKKIEATRKKHAGSDGFLTRRIRAENTSGLRRQLASLPAFMIVYFGHSRFDNDRCQWVCTNNELFDNFDCVFKSPPRLLLSLSCQSAAALPFNSSSLFSSLMENKVEACIGAIWNLEPQIAVQFLDLFLREYISNANTAAEAFNSAIDELCDCFGDKPYLRFLFQFYGPHLGNSAP